MGMPSRASMVTIKRPEEIARMRRAGLVLVDVLEAFERELRPGVTTGELDELAESIMRAAGAVPSFKGYGANPPFPGSICASLNEEVVHGIPSERRELSEGDVLKVDVGVKLDGLFADAAVSIPIGPQEPNTDRLLDATQRGLSAGIDAARVGATIGDVGAAIQRVVEAEGFSIVRELVGHGLGYLPHEDPQVPNYGRPGSGPRIEEGLVIAIEPMVNLGSRAVRTLDDGWTVVTADGSLSAHFEHTVAVTSEGPRVLTGARPRVTIQE